MTITQAMRAAWRRVDDAADDAEFAAAWDAWGALAIVQAEQEKLAERIMQSRTDRLLHAIYGGPTAAQDRAAMHTAYHHKSRGHR